MLTPMLVAALALFPPEQATQAPPAAPGPSQAGVGGSVEAPRPEVSPRGRKVICGTTVIIVDSQIDPKFVISPKRGQSEPTIRRVPKPMCGQGQK